MAGGGAIAPPPAGLKTGRQNDDRGAPATKQIIRIAFNYLCCIV